MAASKKPNERRPKGEAKVITVGWQAVLIPFIILAVVALGFYAGRMLSGSDSSASAVQPTAAPMALGGARGQASSAQGESSEAIQSGGMPAGAFGEGVVDLPARSHPLLNRPVPDFTMTRIDTGEEVKVGDFAGQPLMVNFWATWCPPCRYEMPWIQKVYDDNRDAGFVVLAVNAGERVPPSMLEDTVTQFVDSMDLSFPVLIGDNTLQVQRSWSVTGLPATFFVDVEGNVVDAHQGMFPNLATLAAKVSTLVN